MLSPKSHSIHAAWRAGTRQLLVLSLVLVITGCRGESPSGVQGTSRELAQLVLRDDTRDVLLTWVDGTGDFHVVESIDQVPTESREQVRVAVTTQADGTGDQVYVADLRTKAADGTYPTRLMTRAAWEETGAAKRKARLESLAPVASQIQPVASAATTGESMVAVVYGAEWCGACREAERYLRRKGIKVLEKDVDQSPAVQAELRTKLAKAGMPATSSIPIIDIGGRLIVGFSQTAVDSALQAARR